jgi:hypothetical protein
VRLRLSALALLLFATGCIHHPPATRADYDATITRSDFADWLSSYALETKRETIGKSEKDGIVIVEYEWFGDDGELAIWLHSRVYWTKSPLEADAAFRAMRKSARPREDAFAWLPVHCGGSWAEDKKCYRLVRADRATVGHVLFARRENVAVMVSLTGMHSEDPKLFERKIEPELPKLSAHDPLAEQRP